jgi:hypothetical protein
VLSPAGSRSTGGIGRGGETALGLDPPSGVKSRQWGALAGNALGVVTTLVRDMHAGIASRVFAAVGPAAWPTQIIHDDVARAVYAAVDHGLRGAARVGGAVACEVWGPDGGRSLGSCGRR